MEQLAPTPAIVVEQNVTNGKISGRITLLMRYWLIALADRINATTHVLASVKASTQAASISTTSFPILSVSPGLYRLSMSARISRAATTSSSLIVGGVSCTTASPAMTGNTTSTVGSLTVLARVDEATAITYATTRATVGGTTMQYDLDVSCEQVA